MSALKTWGGFLVHEKLDPARMSDADVQTIMRLVTELATRHPDPKPFRAYADRLQCRRVVCDVAMDLSIDLLGLKHPVSGKVLIGRGLLDVWAVAYQERFGSAVGTAAWHEDKRRKVSSKQAELRRKEATGGPAPAPGS